METFCQYCNEKYRVVKQNYAPCQKIEILDFGEDLSSRNIISLSSNISTCWLIEPFLNQVEVGDMICLTAFYYMTPQQKFVNQRCISPLSGSFVAFDIVKVNPFNQMVDADPKLAGLFYKQSARTSLNTTKCLGAHSKLQTSSAIDPKKLGLTLANIQLHEQNALKSNNQFLPKVNRLIDMVQNHGNHRNQRRDEYNNASDAKTTIF